MPSTYTQNLGIELPATGEQANVWGVTVNRNMNTLDLGMNGNTQLPLSTSPFLLNTDNGADFPLGANRLIIWTGAQTSQGTVRIDWQTARKHIYFMSNQTSGGFGIAFTQGSGNQFVLQAGRDAIVYTDGGGATASAGSVLANPQFTSMLTTGNVTVGGTLQVTGAVTLSGTTTVSSLFANAVTTAGLQVNGNVTMTGSLNGILTTDAQGNVKLTGGLGITNPTAIPDPLTVTGIGVGGQLRLAYGNYGVFFRNDGANFMLMTTNSGDPYGTWKTPWPLTIDLASNNVGIHGAPNFPLTVYGDVNITGTYRVNGAALTLTTPPGGANQQIQFNNNGAFGGSASLLWDGSKLHVGSTSIYNGATGSAVIQPSSMVELFVPTTTVNPTISSGVAFGWNRGNSGKGEVDIWNCFEEGPGGNSAGFQFIQLRNGAATMLCEIAMFGGPYFLGLGGSGTVMSSQGTLYVSSDSRLKNLLGHYAGSLQEVLQLSPVRYRWRPESGLDHGSDNVGFVAQDVQQVIPEAVDTDHRGMLSLSDRPLIAALVNAVKELEKRLRALEPAPC